MPATKRATGGAFAWAALAVVCATGCSSSSPPSGSGDWSGTQSCSGVATGSTTTILPNASIPTALTTAEAQLTVTVTGVNIGPYQGWSCPNQTLMGKVSDSIGTMVKFDVDSADCTSIAMMPTSASGPLSFAATGVVTAGENVDLTLFLNSGSQGSVFYQFSCEYNVNPK